MQILVAIKYYTITKLLDETIMQYNTTISWRFNIAQREPPDPQTKFHFIKTAIHNIFQIQPLNIYFISKEIIQVTLRDIFTIILNFIYPECDLFQV